MSVRRTIATAAAAGLVAIGLAAFSGSLAQADDDACDWAVTGQVIFGDGFANVLVGTPDNDLIFGLGDNDTIFGLGGEDVIVGGDGDDTVFGGDHADVIDGGTGDDNLFGNLCGDDVNGNEDEDELYGGEGADDIEGNEDNDWAGSHRTVCWNPGRCVVSGGSGCVFHHIRIVSHVKTFSI